MTQYELIQGQYEDHLTHAELLFELGLWEGYVNFWDASQQYRSMLEEMTLEEAMMEVSNDE